MDTVKQARKVIEASLALLDEKDQKGLSYQGLSPLAVLDNAVSMTHKHEGKEALVKVWSISEANRLASFIWRKGAMTDELEKAYRELPTLEEAGKDYSEYSDKRKVVADELENQRKVYSDEDRDMQIFQAVLSGISKEKAEKEYKAYQEQVQQAMGK